MRRKIFFIVLIFVIVGGFFLVYFEHSQKLFSLLDISKAERTNEINFYLWEDYIPETLFDDFEEKYGVKVIPIYFDDESKSKREVVNNPDKYDLYIASNFLVDDLIGSEALDEIKINEFVLKSIEENYWDLSNSFNSDYFVPFTYGTTGVIYNKDYFANPPEFSDFFYEGYSKKRGILTDLDVVFYLLFEYSGASSDFVSPNDVYQMGEFFNAQADSTYFGNYAFLVDSLKNESILFATNYGSEFFSNKGELVNFNYSLDPVGFVWTDYFVIPKNSKNKKNAELLIEFLLEKENAAKIMEYSYCIVPVKESMDFVENEDILEYKNLISESDVSLFALNEKSPSFVELKNKIDSFLVEDENEFV